MKRIITLLYAITVCIAGFSQANYTLQFEEHEFSFLKVENGYEIGSKSADYHLLGDITLPALPYKAIYILIPENATVDDVTVNIISTKEIRHDIFIVNNPAVRPTSVTNNNSMSNVITYTKSIYPEDNVKFGTVVQSRGFHIATFLVCPFIYNTQKRSLELITEMNISFNQSRKSTTKSANPSVIRYDMKDFLNGFVINPEEINTLYPQQTTTRGTPNDTTHYLIITSEDLIESFRPLQAWKIKKGVKTEIISTEYIYAHYPGTTNQLQIKHCLKDYYENKNLKWTLLGGDNTVVPVQGCYAHVMVVDNNDSLVPFADTTIPTDLFYACFDNAFDWDANGNGIVGEVSYLYPDDNIDMAPEIYISRLPIRNAEHVTAFVNKLLKYETNPTTTDYIEKMLLSGVKLQYFLSDLGGQSDAQYWNETMYDDYIMPFWNGTKYRFYDTGTDFPGDAAYDVTASNLQTQITNGYHFLHVETHGGTASWTMETGNSYNSTNASALQNTNASVILTGACHTNGFDRAIDPCLSEAFIRNPNGACVAYWGSSREGWGAYSIYLNAQPSLMANAHFYNILFNSLPSSDNYKFAAVTSAAKLKFILRASLYDDVDKWLQFSLNAIGDPEMPIYTQNPISFSNATVSQSGNTVTVNTGGVTGCTIALTSMDLGESYFEVEHNVSSHTFTNVTVPYNVTITKHNYIPFTCATVVDFIDKTVDTTTTVTNPCGDIFVKDVIIQSGATLILKAAGNVIIEGNFEIELGAEFEIW